MILYIVEKNYNKYVKNCKKNESGNIMINKISNVLRRKFQLNNINIDEEYIKMGFKLTNFILFNKDDFTIKIENQDIPFDYIKFEKTIFL